MKKHKEVQAEAATVELHRKLPATGLTGELSAILDTCSRHLFKLQQQATEIVLSEAAAVQAGWLRAVTSMAELLPDEADRANTARLVAIVNDWFQVMTQAQAALVDLIGRSALAGDSPTQRVAFAERRRLAVVINFPDRRRAA